MICQNKGMNIHFSSILVKPKLKPKSAQTQQN
jgi:hypothetical protein